MDSAPWVQTGRNQKMNKNSKHLKSMSLSLVGAALLAACSPVSPSLDKISSLRPLPGKEAIFVVTVSKLNDDEAKVAEESPDFHKITLTEDDEDTKAQFEAYRETGKASFQFEGALPQKFKYALIFDGSTKKKDLEDQEQFQLGYDPKPAADKKTWTLDLDDKSQDQDASERARARLKKITFYFADEVRLVPPAAVVVDEPVSTASPAPSH